MTSTAVSSIENELWSLTKSTQPSFYEWKKNKKKHTKINLLKFYFKHDLNSVAATFVEMWEIFFAASWENSRKINCLRKTIVFVLYVCIVCFVWTEFKCERFSEFSCYSSIYKTTGWVVEMTFSLRTTDEFVKLA